MACVTARPSSLLDAAVDLLRGGHVVTLDSVATAVGLSKAGVVHHFATKEVLMVAVVDRVADGGGMGDPNVDTRRACTWIRRLCSSVSAR